METKQIPITEPQMRLLNAMIFGATKEAASCFEVLRKVVPTEMAANLVVRAQFAAAVSIVISVARAAGQTIRADDLIPILREVVEGPVTGEAEAQAMIERDLAGAVQQ